MKKILISFVLVCFLLTAAFSQNIPNRGFEKWTVHGLFYEEPRPWLTSNTMEAFMNDTVLTVSKTQDAASGSYAMFLESKVAEGDTLAGFAICDGMVDGDYPDLDFVGGFPFTGQPDSLIGYFKYQTQPEDTSWVIVVFKKAGTVLAENWFRLYGSQAEYQRYAFPLEKLTEAPDTAWVGMAAGSPWKPVAGNYLYADRLSFDGDAQSIPNGDFEEWTWPVWNDPDGWQSGNRISIALHSDAMCIATGDAHSGSSALYLKTVPLSFIGTNAGVIATGELEMENVSGGFPVSYTPTVIQGYYKYFPEGDDSAQVVVICSKWDEETATRDRYIRAFALPAAAEYTFFSDTLDLGDVDVDTVNLIVASGWLFGAQHSPPAGSELYLDDLWLGHPCDHTDTLQLFTFRDTIFCTGDSIILDAGGGYASYLWSDSSTTQTITVRDAGVYSVTVTLADGCVATDSVTVHTDACTGTPHMPAGGDVRISPNPCGDYFFLDLPATREGPREIYVYNVLGQRVFEKVLDTATTERLQVDMSGQPAGIYFVRVSSAQGSRVFKVMKR